MRFGLWELVFLVVPFVVYTAVVYVIGKKVGYGRALKDLAQGKFPALTKKNQPD